MLNDKKVVAFICECNPFHEGHKRLIRAAKKKGDIVIAIMSGNFVQRGEPAIYDKYKRTKDLLKNGVSLVIELPTEYSLSSANIFALSSITILNKLKFVDTLIFGSESNDIKKLKEYASIKTGNIDIKKILKSGVSYPKAISKIYNENLSPNDILGVEYIRALIETKSKIIPICIKRENDIPSASELRKNIKCNISNDSFSDILNFKILMAKNNLYDMSKIYCMTEDLKNAILNNIKNQSFTKLAKSLNTKNRTLANIKRVLLCTILNITKDIVGINKNSINYIRILGFKKSFSNQLKNIKVPYLLSFAPSSYKNFVKNFPNSKIVQLNKNGEFVLSPSIKLNIFASDLYCKFSGNTTYESSSKIIIV